MVLSLFLAATSLALMVSTWCRTVDLSVTALPFLLEVCRLYGECRAETVKGRLSRRDLHIRAAYQNIYRVGEPVQVLLSRSESRGGLGRMGRQVRVCAHANRRGRPCKWVA